MRVILRVLPWLLAVCLPVLDAGAAGREAVRDAALKTWVHGITAEVAAQEVGAEGVPFLIELLRDPEFPRRDNVVALLAHLGGDAARQALLEWLAVVEPPPSADPFADRRARLLAPAALGRFARHGDGAALQALLDMTGQAMANISAELYRVLPAPAGRRGGPVFRIAQRTSHRQYQ